MSTDGDGVADVSDVGDYVDLHDGSGEPVLLVGPKTDSGDLNVLIQRIREYGYGVDTEYTGDHQRVYRVHWPADGGDDA